MHVEELREWLRGLVPARHRPMLKRSPAGRVLNRAIYWFDEKRFRLTRSPQADGSAIQEETERLRYSWRTFTTDYLKYRHGQDRDHPSRQAAYDLVGRLGRELLALRPASSEKLQMLEIPFGMGTDFEMSFSSGPFEYTGMELNPKQVQATASRLPTGSWRVGNIFEIPREDNAFSLVYCRHIFEHLSLSAMEVALAETIRVARDRAVFVFFNMREHGEHEAHPVRQYHDNWLSRDLMKTDLEKNPKVTRVIPHRVPARGRYKENWIFELVLDPFKNSGSLSAHKP